VSALAYARRGWPVLPVEPGGKAPIGALVPHAAHSASTDPAVVREWWRRAADANVGVATGARGPTVLDVDDPVAARGVLARLTLEAIPTAATARGLHLFFAGQARATVNLGYGELRGAGSFVVAAPSVHESGREYVWTRLPDHGPLLEVPNFIVGAAARRPGAASTVRRLGASRTGGATTTSRTSRSTCCAPASPTSVAWPSTCGSSSNSVARRLRRRR
jgi:hypothetical protein